MKSVDERKQRIRNLKASNKEIQDDIVEMIKNVDVKEESELPEEEQKNKKDAFGAKMAEKRAVISANEEEMKKLRENKYGSSFFEFTPNKGMNRRQARQFRRSRA